MHFEMVYHANNHWLLDNIVLSLYGMYYSILLTPSGVLISDIQFYMYIGGYEYYMVATYNISTIASTVHFNPSTSLSYDISDRCFFPFVMLKLAIGLCIVWTQYVHNLEPLSGVLCHTCSLMTNYFNWLSPGSQS